MPWGHITVLLDKITDPADRDWYAAAAVEHGWTRKVLLNQIIGQLHRRLGAAPSNFTTQLAPPDSELAQELTKDPYVFDFLSLTTRTRERDLERALMDRLQETLLEFGRGFAFVGRQVHFDVDGSDYYADLVLFNVDQLRYVVVELKIGQFEPEHLGQLGFYVAVVDDRLRRDPTPPRSGSCCAPAATTPSSATPWPTPTPPWPSPAIPPAPSTRPNSTCHNPRRSRHCWQHRSTATAASPLLINCPKAQEQLRDTPRRSHREVLDNDPRRDAARGAAVRRRHRDLLRQASAVLARRVHPGLCPSVPAMSSDRLGSRSPQ